MDFLALPQDALFLASFAGVVEALLYVIFVFSAILLILVILLQEGKGGGFGDVFGGAGSEAFGPRVGGVNKFTASLAAFFIVSLIGIHLINRPPTPEELPPPEDEVSASSNPGINPANPNASPFPGQPGSQQPAEKPSPAELVERSVAAFSPAGAPQPRPAAGSLSWDDPSWGLSPEERRLKDPPPAPVSDADADAAAGAAGDSGAPGAGAKGGPDSARGDG